MLGFQVRQFIRVDRDPVQAGDFLRGFSLLLFLVPLFPLKK
jgi:hypothetical protein